MPTTASRQRAFAAQRGNPGPSGFSIIELLIVAAIISVLAALAAPRYGNSVARYRADGAARRIEADFELARNHAMTTSATVEVRFTGGANASYALVGLTHPDSAASPYVVSLTGDLYGAALISADFDGDSSVFFDMYGRPDSGGSVVISVAGYARTIVVDAETGEASYD
jgi:prepilin-type N-terminal cleavage/methylation domain-containing protein